MIFRFQSDADRDLWQKVTTMGWDRGEVRGDVERGPFALFLPLRRRWWFGINDPVAAIFTCDGKLVSVERFWDLAEARGAWSERVSRLDA